MPLANYHSPFFIDIEEETDECGGSMHWEWIAFRKWQKFIRLGGAADRLHLVDEKTGLELPAAKLPFAGKTLLEHLIRDLAGARISLFQIARQTTHHADCHDDFS